MYNVLRRGMDLSNGVPVWRDREWYDHGVIGGPEHPCSSTGRSPGQVHRLRVGERGPRERRHM